MLSCPAEASWTVSFYPHILPKPLILTFSFIVLSLDGFSLTSNFSAVLACFNNIGPGLEIVGPASNYSAYSDLSKGVLIFDMLAGRLELFPILALFVPRTWMRH